MTLIRERAAGMTTDERRVIFASSLGTVCEWYDFYLYATLAPFFAALFFPPGNDTAALLSAFATYAAGFLVRPFGAIIFGRIGDLVGRKYTFLITILVMGGAPFAVGLLPTFASRGAGATTSRRLFLLGLGCRRHDIGVARRQVDHAVRARAGQPGTWLWIGVEDADVLLADFSARGVRIHTPPQNFSGAYEFQVEDPDGHVLRIGSEPKPGATGGVFKS